MQIQNFSCDCMFLVKQETKCTAESEDRREGLEVEGEVIAVCLRI